MKEEILSIASDLREGFMTTDQAKEQLLILFDVVRQSEKCGCKNAKFTRIVNDNYEPICGRCGNEI